jgi:hypothetical protein
LQNTFSRDLALGRPIKNTSNPIKILKIIKMEKSLRRREGQYLHQNKLFKRRTSDFNYSTLYTAKYKDAPQQVDDQTFVSLFT